MMRSFLVLVVCLTAASPALAQLPQTRLFSLSPPGIAPGQISDVRINTGADLDRVDRLIFGHPGIFASPKQQPDADGGFIPVPNTFRVAVEDDVPPGRYAVRAVGLFGTSNARSLIIDPRPALAEQEPNNSAEQAQSIEIGTLVDGQINGAGDLDVVRFSARQGERIVIDCLAERIDSRLNPMLTLSNADARPIAFARNEYGRDAFLAFDVPADGDYFIELRDETFAGGGEHFYRLQIHRGPHILFVMPPAGVPGTTGAFTLYGYNLPGGERLDQPDAPVPLERLDVEIAVPAQAESVSGVPSVSAGLDLFAYRLESEGAFSNRVLIGLATAPVHLEAEPDDDPAAAQKLAVPFEVAGQLTAPTDVDRFTFEATKDQPLWIEVIGQRGGVPLDPFVTIEQITTSAEGFEQIKSVATQDDLGTNLAANVFDTASDDPAFLFTAGESATYRISLRDRASSGGEPDPSRVYRLIVRPPRPDFRLVAVPAGLPAGQTWPIAPRRGDHFALDVLAFRRDGFTGPIEVRPLALPPGITTHGTVIREGEPSARLVLSASELAATDPAPVRLAGSARVGSPHGETTIEHPVRSGAVVWGRAGNTPAISQTESDLLATVSAETAPYQLSFEFPPVTVHQGRQLLIPMTLARRRFGENLTLKFDDTRKNARVDLADLTFAPGQTAGTCRLFVRPDAPPGTWVISGTCEAQVPYRRNPLQAEAAATAKTIAEQEAQRAKARTDKAAERLRTQVEAVKQADAALQQAKQAEAAGQENVNRARQAMASARQAHGEAATEVATLTEELKQATVESEEAASVADDSDDESLSSAAEEAQQRLAEKQKALAAAQQAQTQAAEQLTQAEAAVKSAAEALSTAQAQTKAASTARQATEELRIAVESRHAAAAARAKAKEEARKAAEKAATDAANAAKPNNIAVHQPVPPLILTIKPAPVALEAKPAGVEVRAGQSLDVAVTVKRQNDFAGPVKLSLAIPEGIAGLSAPEVEIAAEADTGVLKVVATSEAPEGDIANLVVRATMNAGGEAIVDAPLALKVVK